MKVLQKSLAVGSDSPFHLPGRGAVSMAFNTTLGCLTGVIHLPDVTEADRAFVDGAVAGIGLFQDDRNVVGSLTVVLSSGPDRQWPVSAPIWDDLAHLKNWARDADATALALALIDSNSNKIAAFRTISLPSDLLDSVRQAVLAQDKPLPGYALSVWHGEMSDLDRWNAGKRWLYDPKRNQLKREG